MKTAMQELMQWMEETEFMVNSAFINKVNECLGKEKEQIIDAYKSGVKLIAGDIEDASNYYYNQTYKPETI